MLLTYLLSQLVCRAVREDWEVMKQCFWNLRRYLLTCAIPHTVNVQVNVQALSCYSFKREKERLSTPKMYL